MVSSIPKRPPTAIRPITAPGQFSVALTVDGLTMEEPFHVSANPKETYSQEEMNQKFAFWMDMYNNVESSSQKVIAAVTLRDEVNEKLESYKNSGASAGKIKKAEKAANALTARITQYEGAFVSTGRTLAEIINLPATILSKMAFMSTMLEQSEGPETQQMREMLKRLKEDSQVAHESYQADIEALVSRFEKSIQD